jgi:hypothetical protein
MHPRSYIWNRLSAKIILTRLKQRKAARCICKAPNPKPQIPDKLRAISFKTLTATGC